MKERIEDIDASGHNGLDGVYLKDGKYYIVEGKYYGSGSLNKANETTGLPRQMSDNWINTRDWEVVDLDQSIIDEILTEKNYFRILARVKKDGSVSYDYVSKTGYLRSGDGPLGEFKP